MSQFTDAKNEKWDVDVTGETIRRAMRLLGIDLGKPLDGDPPPMVRFHADIIFQVDLLYVVCMTQAEKRGITDEEFGQRLGGQALHDATEAFEESLLLFFQNLGREETVEGMKKNAETTRRMLAEVASAIGSVEANDFIDREIATLGKRFVSTLQSLESNRDREPSES